MTDLNKLFKQYWHFILLAGIAIVVITLVSAISGDSRQPGSSYSIAPNGYSTWYQMMSDRGIKIQRWQKSFPALSNFSNYETGVTLLQVNPQLERLDISNLQQKWVSQGNTLAILGVTAPAWEIPFRSKLESPQGDVKIETTRRFRSDITRIRREQDVDTTSVLSDRTGSVIRQFKLDKGVIIFVTTPHLAANAYQDARPNYELLAELVTKDRQQVLVDEYIHGYRDRKSGYPIKDGARKSDADIEEDGADETLAYLFKTPLLVAFINLLLGILVLIWQQNRRFGKVVMPKPIEIDNSEAYIQALGGVLRQANSSEFAVQNIGRAEQLAWQQKLGLGKERLVDAQILIAAWEERVRLPTDDLRFVLQLTTGARRLTPVELTTWLEKIRKIDRQIDRL
jgi:Domain of unknown function (DUF4350)